MPRQAIRWRGIGESITGVAHERSGRPNQDALRIAGDADDGPVVITVADGHGSAPSFRSDVGARLAVHIAAESLFQFHREVSDYLPAMIAEMATRQIPKRIVAAWRDAVRQHHARHPFSATENGNVAPSDTTVLLAYGATLLAVLATERFGLFLQLGDGDLLIVADGGEVSAAIERDARLIANETTSLCQADAERYMHLRVEEWRATPPALILLATDGYGNSFADEAEFRKIGPDYLDAIRADGIAAVQARMNGWLAEASRGGSGDDITLGMLCRADISPAAARGSNPSHEYGSHTSQSRRTLT